LTTLLAAHPLVHVNASLNALATTLLLLGLFFIKQGRVTLHKYTMLAAFVVSVVFLVCYLWYHAQVGSVRFTHPGLVRYTYLMILASHVLLAATVPFLAVRQIYLGYRALGCCSDESDLEGASAMVEIYRQKHIRLAKWAYSIWLYVSVTGVVVYVMLYHLWPPTGQ
jgi:putative membrane protein